MFQAETGPRLGVLGLLLVAGFFAAASPARAQENVPVAAESASHNVPGVVTRDENQNEHYRIDDPAPKAISPAAFESPDQILENAQTAFDAFLKSVGTVVHLTDWLKLNGPMDPTSDPYNRLSKFGNWKHDSASGTCLDARGVVLARTSTIPVTTHTSGSGHCTVDSGHWVDPYNGQEFTVGSKVSIDHVVPLKNAYISGAWRWSNQKRCQYFNFTASPDHFYAISIPENSSKGDSSPADYMPPERGFQCQYLKSWLSVKAVWALDMGGDEATAIREEVKQLGCKEEDLLITTDEVTKLRGVIAQGTAACPPGHAAGDVTGDVTGDGYYF